MKHKDLYKIDKLSFNTKIGSITNIGTTYYEMLSQYKKGSIEYNEIYDRLRLCCIEQSKTIDSAKGLIIKEFPKHWTKYQKTSYDVLESIDDFNEVERIQAIDEFNNKLLIDNKRPYFMRYVYPIKNKEYRNFLSDFNRLSRIYYGCDIKDIAEEEKDSERYQTLKAYYEQKSPLMETNGVMNKICYHMEKSIKEFKLSEKYKKNENMINLLYNDNVETDLKLLPKMLKVYEDYISFKKNKMLSESKYNTNEQYYKALKNECLENISSSEKELANLAIHIMYKVYPKKPKDFVWDCFGNGVLANVLKDKESVWLPLKNNCGNIEYLGSNYSNNMIPLKNGAVDTAKILESYEEVDWEGVSLEMEDNDYDDDILSFDF